MTTLSVAIVEVNKRFASTFLKTPLEPWTTELNAYLVDLLKKTDKLKIEYNDLEPEKQKILDLKKQRADSNELILQEQKIKKEYDVFCEKYKEDWGNVSKEISAFQNNIIKTRRELVESRHKLADLENLSAISKRNIKNFGMMDSNQARSDELILRTLEQYLTNGSLTGINALL